METLTVLKYHRCLWAPFALQAYISCDIICGHGYLNLIFFYRYIQLERDIHASYFVVYISVQRVIIILPFVWKSR